MIEYWFRELENMLEKISQNLKEKRKFLNDERKG